MPRCFFLLALLFLITVSTEFVDISCEDTNVKKAINAASKKIGASIPSQSDFTLKQTWGCRKETVDSKTNYAFTIRGRDTHQNDYVYNCHVARSTGGDYTVSHLESVYAKNDREYRKFPWQGMVF